MEKLVERNLAIANKVQAIFKEKKIKPVEFAKMLAQSLQKYPDGSVVNKI